MGIGTNPGLTPRIVRWRIQNCQGRLATCSGSPCSTRRCSLKKRVHASGRDRPLSVRAIFAFQRRCVLSCHSLAMQRCCLGRAPYRGCRTWIEIAAGAALTRSGCKADNLAFTARCQFTRPWKKSRVRLLRSSLPVVLHSSQPARGKSAETSPIHRRQCTKAYNRPAKHPYARLSGANSGANKGRLLVLSVQHGR
jgi:hypothetical protein